MSASYGIDKAELVVWLDSSPALDPALAGSLCRRHADALIVPKGWRIDDRRESIPRLFHAPDTEVREEPEHSRADLAVIEQTPGGGVRRRAHRGSRDESAQASLFDESDVKPTIEPAASPDVPTVPSGEEETRAIPWMPRLVSRSAHADTAVESEEDSPSGDGTDATPAQGRLLRRAFGDRNVR